MVHVIGNNYRKVELRDLNDFVYYKQQKVYTDSQLEHSRDLQAEIKKGSLTVLSKTDDKSGTFSIPTVLIPTSVSPTDSPVSSIDSSKIDTVLDRIQGIEKTLSMPTVPVAQSTESSTVQSLLDKVGRLETEISRLNSAGPATMGPVIDALKKLEDRIDQKSVGGDLIKKLEDILNKASDKVIQPSGQQLELMRPEDVYVPSIMVEDANTHIKLDTRKIETGDTVSDSLKKLRELKLKTK